jgi:hypothetical protein
MSKTLERLKAEIESMLLKFRSSTDLEEKQQLLKKVQLALEEAGELADRDL